LNRTPSAVSHAFGNLWYPWSHERHGARNASHLCKVVVDEFRTDPEGFHRRAATLRHAFVTRSLPPRIEIHETRGEGALHPALSSQIARETGLGRGDFVIYTRTGTITSGAVLGLEILGYGTLAGIGYTVGSRFVKYVEKLVKRRLNAGRTRSLVLRSATWRALHTADSGEVETIIVEYYLPSLKGVPISPRLRAALAGNFSLMLGVQPVREKEATDAESLISRPGGGRIAEMEKRVGESISELSDDSLVELDAVLRAADSKAFKRTVRDFRKSSKKKTSQWQRSIDDYSH